MNEKSIHRYDLQIMESCIEIAKKSNMRSKHGCIIVDNKGKLLSSACNKRTNLKDEHIEDVFIRRRKAFSKHAEETALKNLNRDRLKGARLYVVRWGYRKGCSSFLNSKPCTKCTAIINACITNYGLKAAYYSTDMDPFCQIIG